ncbi:hypothetical protein VTK26DRAFT_1576 [Humicola hyalothermophila]
MASFGRFVCVLIPFALTVASLVALLVAGLAGITDKSLYMFQVNLTDLQISPSQVSGILNGSAVPNLDDINIDIPGIDFGKRQEQDGVRNITAVDLGFDDLVDVSIWGYCSTSRNGTRECTKPKFDWATDALNTTTGDINTLLTSTGLNVTLPDEIGDAVKLFGNAIRWTQIVFVIACIALGVELFFGMFANCSRIFSCITWLVALFAAVAVGAAVGLATATSVIVVGAVEAIADDYGISADLHKRFLATIWISAAFAIGAALFWVFTICCCAPDHSSRSSSRHLDEHEKFIPNGSSDGTPYHRLGEPGAYQSGYARQSYGPARSGAYEPYSHTRV